MNLPGAMNFHIQNAALKSFSKSLTFELWKTRDEKAVPKGERRGLSVALRLSAPNTKDQHTGKKASVS